MNKEMFINKSLVTYDPNLSMQQESVHDYIKKKDMIVIESVQRRAAK